MWWRLGSRCLRLSAKKLDEIGDGCVMKREWGADQMIEEVFRKRALRFTLHCTLGCKVPEFDHRFSCGWEFKQEARCPRYLHLPAERAT